MLSNFSKTYNWTEILLALGSEQLNGIMHKQKYIHSTYIWTKGDVLGQFFDINSAYSFYV